MPQRLKSTSDEGARAKLRLLMAASALFVLLGGLTFLIFIVLRGLAKPQEATLIFFPFLLTGLLLFAASAFINTELVKAFLDAASPLKGDGKS